MSEQAADSGAAPRRPYEPPAIKFEQRIETFATACTCSIMQKSGVTVVSFGGGTADFCGADNFS